MPETFIGTAYNAKRGAILETSSGQVYYLQGMEEWDLAFLGKKVEVIGPSKEEKYINDPVNTAGELVQGAEGRQWVIYPQSWRRLA